MTARARFTQADLTRAIAVADKTGKVAVQTPMGIAYLDPERAERLLAPNHTPAQGSGSGVISCDDLFPPCG